jgi:hypothetical protein
MKSLFAASLAIFASGGWAGLGDGPANLGPHALTTRTHQASTGAAATYTQVDRTLDSGTSVHEYVDAHGAVFAVSWSGPFLPDLKEILGSHFEALAARAGRREGAGRSSQLVVKQAHLVIVSGGHMGAFEGKAWLPARLPAGFNPDGIQ